MPKDKIKAMKILYVLFSFVLILSACGKNNTIDSSSSQETKTETTDASTTVENFKKLLKQHQTKGEEDWILIVSPDLIFIGEIETNRSQPRETRGFYQCSLSTKLIRLSDGKMLEYGDVFNAPAGKLADEILDWIKKNRKLDLDRDQVIYSLQSLSFETFTSKKINLIDESAIWLTCDMTLFDEIPLDVIRKHLTKWMSDQLNLKLD